MAYKKWNRSYYYIQLFLLPNKITSKWYTITTKQIAD